MKKKMLLVGLSFALVVTLSGCSGDSPKPDGKAEGIPSSFFSEEMTLIADSMTLPNGVSKNVQQNDVRQSGEQSASADEKETKGKVDTAGTSKSQDSQKEKGTMAKEQQSGQTKPKSTPSQNQPVAPEKNESGAGKSQASVPQKNSSQANLSQENIPQGNASQESVSQGNVSQEGTSQGNVSGGVPQESNWQQEPEPIVETAPNATAADSEQVASKVLEYINSYRSSPATSLSGLGGYARYRSRQLVSNFAHDTNAERAAATALCYGEYVDPSLYGMTGEPYYTACVREAIAKGGYVGTVDEVAESIAQLIKNSSGHWNYVGSSEYPYIGVGVTYEGGMWYCDVAVAMENTDNK